jgi:tetratricopeptide (TPR) repeat protein
MQINDLLRTACKAPDNEKFILSIRQKGYALSPQWAIDTVPILERTVAEDLQTLAHVVASCISVVEGAPFSADDQGTKTICVEPGLVQKNAIIFHSNTSRILDIIRGRCAASTFNTLSELISLLETYVLFSRSGVNISDAEWRAAFKNEIVSVYQQIRDGVVSLQNVPELPRNTASSTGNHAENTHNATPLVVDMPPDGSSISIPAGAKTTTRSDLRHIRLITAEYEVPPDRVAVLEAIDHHLVPTDFERLRIVSLQGPCGIGKTQAVAEWWTCFGRKKPWGSVFTYDCSRSPGDRIIRALNAHFLGNDIEEIQGALIDAIDRAGHSLIILDGLARYAPFIRTIGHSAPTDADNIALERVRELIRALADAQTRASILVIIQTEHPDKETLYISQQLHAGVSYATLTVPPLSDGDGAFLMSQLGVEGVATEDLRRISRALMGLPLSIVAAAQHLCEVDPTAREEFVIRLSARSRGFEDFREFFERYIELLSLHNQNPEAHPYAFLRLLALMPGPVAKTRIRNLLARGEIRRLRRATLETFQRSPVAFVNDLGEYLDIHIFVRYLLREELRKIGTGEKTEPTANREEIARIHAVCLEEYLRHLPVKRSEFSAVQIDTIEGAVYHLLSLRDFLPEEQHSDGVSHDISVANDDAVMRHRIVTMTATSEEMTKYCLDRIAGYYLLDRHHHATRFLGQFETKARILTYFLEDNDLHSRIRYLSLSDQRRLLFEIGVCWMHAGRLNLAHIAMSRAVEITKSGVTHLLGQPADRSLGGLLSSPDAARQWIEHAETLSTFSVIATRLGRPADEVVDLIERDVVFAKYLAKMALSEQTGDLCEAIEVLRAVRRLIARLAHISLLKGSIEEALEDFRLATHLESIIGRPFLTGDAGRRYIQSLIRSAASDTAVVSEAGDLLEKILSLNGAMDGTRKQQSNEIIPLLTTKIMIHRLRGEFDEALSTLAVAVAHKFVLTGECTYAARVELELEKARLQLAVGRVDETVAQTLRELRVRLHDTHHFLYAIECEALLGEALPLHERGDILRKTEIIARSTGWLLRCEDIHEIHAEGSALKRFGC